MHSLDVMEKKRIEEFIKQYADSVANADFEKIVSHYPDRFVLSTQKHYLDITNNDEFKTNLAKSFEVYKTLGAKFCNLIKFDIITFPSNHCMANVEWGLFDDDSNLLMTFDISYCIKEMNGDLKYIFVIAHNEEEHIEEYLRKNETNKQINK